MAENTEISWADRTWSPWYGCTQVSMGAQGACVACYARQISETRMGRVVFGAPGRGEGTRDAKAESGWLEPLKWERAAAAEACFWDGYSPRDTEFVFPSMCDPFDNHPDLPPLLRRFFDLIRATPHLTWLLLTKRPGNIVKLFEQALSEADKFMRVDPPLMTLAECWPRNAAIGFTAVTQREMDRDSKAALAAFTGLNPAFLFWSGEPLLGPIVVPEELLALGERFWAITGGETDQGQHKARPTLTDWERSIRDQCTAASVPYQRKQAGEWLEDTGWYEDHPVSLPVRALDANGAWSDNGNLLGPWMVKVGKKVAGRLLDGVTHDARPTTR